jgi:large subunit ribosomal protein L18
MLTAKELFERRRKRTRSKLRGSKSDQPRLSVHRSSKHISAQIIDDTAGTTLAAASTLDADFKSSTSKTADVAAAIAVGKLVAERAKKKGVDAVVFDRGGYIFHGRVKALAEAAREAGLKF